MTSLFSTLRRAVATALLAGGPALVGCNCEGPPPPSPETSVGRINAVPAEDGFDLVVTSDAPLRTLQVDVKLAGARATAARALGPSDVLESGLAAPREDFTLVLSDTRKLNLPVGSVAHVTTDAPPASITLSRAIVVDATGARRTLTVVLP